MVHSLPEMKAKLFMDNMDVGLDKDGNPLQNEFFQAKFGFQIWQGQLSPNL